MWPHWGAYFSNCVVIGHSTCQTAMSLVWVGCCIVTRPFSSPGGWGLGMRLRYQRMSDKARRARQRCSSLFKREKRNMYSPSLALTLTVTLSPNYFTVSNFRWPCTLFRIMCITQTSCMFRATVCMRSTMQYDVMRLLPCTKNEPFVPALELYPRILSVTEP